ncbi:MAG: diaminopimelate decarboxylase [Acidobacteria bacterium]|nr:diaminopimelate decarboxylase [Acidobacteriota bacterium]
MSGFAFLDGQLACDGYPVATIARDHGTPLYLYSGAAIRAAYGSLDRAFAGYPHTVHFALKANSTLAILRLLRGLGASADANSGGEIEAALRAGFDPSQIVFTGVGKTRDELDRAVALGVNAINIESDGEADRIDALARARGVTARVAVRVNPDIDPNTHAHISTGLRVNKFGVPLEFVAPLLRSLARKPGLEPVGVHVHLGSQIVDVEPLARAARVLADLAREVRDAGVRLKHIDMGGGLGIAYDGVTMADPAAYAAAVLPAIRETGLHLIIEPGRFLLAAAGILVGRVADTKSYAGSPRFIVLDTGMTELIRPMLYEAVHRIVAVAPRPGADVESEVVGPLCETSDTLGHARMIGPVEVDDLIAVLDAGAYGFVMASNYNRRRFPAEVLVDDGQWRVIRRRQTYDDLFRNEQD